MQVTQAIRRTALAATIATLPTTALAQTICTQSLDNVTITAGSIACVNQATNTHVDNSYLRRYSLASQCMSTPGSSIAAVHFGIENATAGAAGAGQQMVNVRLYSIDPMATLTFANMSMLIDEPVMVPDQALAIFTAPLSMPVFVPAGDDLVVELFTPDGSTNGNVFFIGSNAAGQTDPGYIAAPGCGANEPTDLAAVGSGFPNMHIVLDVEFGMGFGANYCGPAVANSTGASATMSASGSPIVANNSLTLVGEDLPDGSFAFFLTSMAQGFVANPGGSQGNLCLSAPIGRYVGPGQIQQSMMGTITLPLDLTQTPTPTGLVAIAAGETWNFQAWYRDVVGASATSNFTDGLSITFQ